MSPALRSLTLTVRAVFTMVAPLVAGSAAVFGALMAWDIEQAWAASASGWAPMCDLDAASVVAPPIAPPVEAGEITVCPDGTVLEDFDQMLLLQGSAPSGEPEPVVELDAPAPRVLPAIEVAAPRFAGVGELLVWPSVRVGPAVAFGRSPDRPPCA